MQDIGEKGEGSQLNAIKPFPWMLLGLTICHFQTDNSLLSGVERGNYQNGQNYGIMELSAGGWCASGKAIYITGRLFYFF